MSLDPATLVAQQLALAGITPSAEEVADMAASTEARMAELEAVWAVAEARYEEPALIFDAAAFS